MKSISKFIKASVFISCSLNKERIKEVITTCSKEIAEMWHFCGLVEKRTMYAATNVPMKGDTNGWFIEMNIPYDSGSRYDSEVDDAQEIEYAKRWFHKLVCQVLKQAKVKPSPYTDIYFSDNIIVRSDL